jgi:MFS family permease
MENNTSKGLMTLGGIVLAVVAGYFIFSIIWKFIFFIISALGILVLIMNHKLVVSLFSKLSSLYDKQPVIGVMAVILAVIASPVVIVLLAGKTVFDFMQNEDAKKTKPMPPVTPHEEIKPTPPIANPTNADEKPIF